MTWHSKASAVGTLLFVLLSGLAFVATAHATPSFGSHDVRTVFHIAKSDDRNRVDYGVHLNAQCQPVGEEPVYAYWHRFEPGHPRFGDLGFMDSRVYGITSQAVRTRSDNGTWVEMHLAAFPEMRILVLIQRHEGQCVARAQIPVRNRPAFVDRVFVQLRPLGVEYVRFRGIDVQTGQPVSERRRPPSQW
ncbi:MAG: DUF4833 domain-containing protein [Sandaracinaceae bacterium]